MKKLVAIALILSLGMFSVVGCGNPAPKPKDNKAGAAAKPGETKPGETKPGETKPGPETPPPAK
jgi:hypothetical protein